VATNLLIMKRWTYRN